MARTKPQENATDGDADRARELSDAIADLKEGMGKLLGGLDTLHYNLREVELMARIVTGDRKREAVRRDLAHIQECLEWRRASLEPKDDFDEGEA